MNYEDLQFVTRPDGYLELIGQWPEALNFQRATLDAHDYIRFKPDDEDIEIRLWNTGCHYHVTHYDVAGGTVSGELIQSVYRESYDSEAHYAQTAEVQAAAAMSAPPPPPS